MGGLSHPSATMSLFASGAGNSMKWFRFWNDTINDVKILQLSDYEYRMWTYLLSYASSSDCVSGQLQITFRLLSLHFHQRFNLFSHAIETFQKVGLISVDKEGYITIINWNKRQFKSDNAYSRVKKYREVTKKRNVSSNVSVTAPDTDTDTDINKPPISPKKTKVKKEKPTPPEKTKFMDCVLLSDDEITKLKLKLVNGDFERAIEILNHYKMSSGKKYSSDYHAILNWVVKEVEKRKTPVQANIFGGNYARPYQTRGERPRGALSEEDERDMDAIAKRYEEAKAAAARKAKRDAEGNDVPDFRAPGQ